MAQQIDQQVRLIAKALRQEQDERLALFGLTAPQGRLLGLILHLTEQGVSFGRKELQDKVNLAGPSVTSLLNSLEKGGFIVRSSGLRDARTTSIKPTAKGRQVGDQMLKVFELSRQKMLQGLNEQEQRDLARLLARVAQNLWNQTACPCAGAGARHV